MRDDSLWKFMERALRIEARKTRKSMTIENCKFEFECPKKWASLKKDGRLDSRFCEVCSRRVYLCVTDEELRARAEAGECVVIFRPSRARSSNSYGVEIFKTERTMGMPYRRSDEESEDY